MTHVAVGKRDEVQTQELVRVMPLIALVACAATGLFMARSGEAWHAIASEPVRFAGFAAVTLVLQLVSVEIYGRGAVSFASTGLLALGFTFGPRPAMLAAVAAAASRMLIGRGKLHRALFDAGSLALATAAGSATYVALAHGRPSTAEIGAALGGSASFLVVNVGLLALVMALAEQTSPLAVWRERFRWMTPYTLAAGALALALVVADDRVGLAGVFAFALPPAFMMLSTRQYLTRTRAAVDEVREKNEELAARNSELGDLVERVRRQHLATIAALSRSMEAKDYYTGSHTERVASVAMKIARRLGYEDEQLHAIEIGALLHDIGKIGIPERILHKPDSLDKNEWEIMKRHPVTSEYILSEVDVPPVVLQIARSSHERIDGAGYPDGLTGEDIPLPARIVLVADALDAMTSDRPYRRARSTEAAMEELRANAGTQFCAKVVAALEQIYREQPSALQETTLRVVA